MAAGAIITVLSNIPWGQVVENAPRIVEGAAKLWNAVARSRPDKSQEAEADATVQETDSATELLQKELVAIREHVHRLEEQMAASSELIKELAEQHAQLVTRIELNSVRYRRLVIVTVIGAVCLAGISVYLFLRP